MNNFKETKKNRNIKQLVLSAVMLFVLVAGWSYSALGIFIFICMISGIAIGFFKGRKWCDWYCPRGSFLDSIAKKISPGKNIPAALKNKWLRIGVIVFLMGMMVFQLARRWPDQEKIGLVFMTLLTVTTVISLILSFFIHQRTWCFVCPVGTIASGAGAKKYKIKLESEKCTLCGACARVCPAQIIPYSYKGEGTVRIENRDCIKCGLCVSACPEQALKKPE